MFDKNNGSANLSNGIILAKNAALSDLKMAGIIFTQEIDMETGWTYRMTGPHSIFCHLANFALGFKDDVLKNYSFTFVEKKTISPDVLHVMHNDALVQEFGPPDLQREGSSSYYFPWGGLVSEFDVRGGACNILVSWGGYP
jgi:hypothetical protein